MIHFLSAIPDFDTWCTGSDAGCTGVQYLMWLQERYLFAHPYVALGIAVVLVGYWIHCLYAHIKEMHQVANRLFEESNRLRSENWDLARDQIGGDEKS